MSQQNERRGVFARAAAFLACLLVAAGATGQQWDVELVSAATPSVTAGGDSTAAGLSSADGRWVLFGSRAANLVDDVPDLNAAEDVFLHDRVSGNTTLISRSIEPGQGSADWISTPGAISADGRWIAFQSAATDLTPDQYTYESWIFLHDRVSGTMQRIVGGDGLRAAKFSSDGRWLLLVGRSPDATNGSDDEHHVYLYGRETGSLLLVSHVAGDTETRSDGETLAFDISSDGRWVLLESNATDLVEDIVDRNNRSDVFAYDRLTRSARLISASRLDPLQSASHSSNAVAMTPDGRHVLLNSCAHDLTDDESVRNRCYAFLHDREAETPVSRVGIPDARSTQRGLALSADARWLVLLADTGTLYLCDLVAGAIRVVRDVDADSRFVLPEAEMTPDGRWLSFRTGPVEGGVNAGSDLYLYSRESGETRFLSMSAGDDPETAAPLLAGISADGAWALFESKSDLHVEGDTNLVRDVFLHDISDDSTRLVSRKTRRGRATAVGATTGGLLSGDGRWFVFRTEAPNQEDSAPRPPAAGELLLYDVAGRRRLPLGRLGGSDMVIHDISRDARWLLVVTTRTDLVEDIVFPPQSTAQVYRYDRINDAFQLVSHRSGEPHEAVNRMRPLGMSADGCRILLSSPNTVLVDGTAGWLEDQLYLYDCDDASMRLVSHAAGQPDVVSNGYVGRALLSADGNYVAFGSDAGNIGAEGVDGNRGEKIFLYDRNANITTMISRSVSGQGSANATVYLDAIDESGQRVLFESKATDLVVGTQDLNTRYDVFLYDHATGSNRLISHTETAPDRAANGSSSGIALSGDGSTVLMFSDASSIDADIGNPSEWYNQFTYDTNVGRGEYLPHSQLPLGLWATHLGASFDGQRVAYRAIVPAEAQEPVVGTGINLLLRDRTNARLESITPAAIGVRQGANGDSSFIAISADGRTVAFASTATNLVRDVSDGNGESDLFVATRNDRIFRGGFESD